MVINFRHLVAICKSQLQILKVSITLMKLFQIILKLHLTLLIYF